jgi:hypothetical protein
MLALVLIIPILVQFHNVEGLTCSSDSRLLCVVLLAETDLRFYHIVDHAAFREDEEIVIFLALQNFDKLAVLNRHYKGKFLSEFRICTAL